LSNNHSILVHPEKDLSGDGFFWGIEQVAGKTRAKKFESVSSYWAARGTKFLPSWSGNKFALRAGADLSPLERGQTSITT
jgi:hypothetical protein